MFATRPCDRYIHSCGSEVRYAPSSSARTPSALKLARQTWLPGLSGAVRVAGGGGGARSGNDDRGTGCSRVADSGVRAWA
eukprot:340751-Prymnesium_polylepis.1